MCNKDQSNIRQNKVSSNKITSMGGVSYSSISVVVLVRACNYLDLLRSFVKSKTRRYANIQQSHDVLPTQTRQASSSLPTYIRYTHENSLCQDSTACYDSWDHGSRAGGDRMRWQGNMTAEYRTYYLETEMEGRDSMISTDFQSSSRQIVVRRPWTDRHQNK